MLTIGLVNYSAVPTIQVPFKIIVACQVSTLTYITPPPSFITIKVGIDTQPSFYAFSVTKTPNCPQAVTFLLSGTAANFVSIQNQLNASADIQVTGVTISNHGSYLLTLLAEVDSKTASASFTVQIQDPCSYAVFETSPAPISDMSLTLYPSRSVSVLQNFRIYTDIERLYSSIICPITAQVLLSKPFILMASDCKSILIDGKYASLLDAGQHTFTVQVNSSVFESVRADYSLKVVLKACYSTQFWMTNTITDISYDTTLGTLTTTPFQIQQTNEDCGYLVTYSLAIAQNLVTIPKPDWLTTDFMQRTLSISQTQKTDVGAYDVTITASIPQIDPTTSSSSVSSFLFKIIIIDECLKTAFIDRQFGLVSAKVSQGPVTADLTVDDQVSYRHVNAGYCGTKTYKISPTLPFLNLIGATLYVESQSAMEAGDYPLTLLISLSSYSGIASLTGTFLVQIQCEVISITAILAPYDVTFKLHTDTVSITPFSFQEFPSCGLTYFLTPNHKNFIVLDSSTRQISVSTEKDEDEGLYNLSLQVTPQTFGAQRTFPFKINVTNPCLKTEIRSSTLIPNVLALVPAKPFYDIPVSFYHTVQNTTNCGEIEAYVRDFKTKKTPSWSKLEGQRLQINLENQTKEIQSQMELVATLSRYPDIKYVQQFNVTLNTLNVQCSLQTMNYELGAELSMQVFYSIQTQHTKKLTPIFSSVSIDDLGNEMKGLPPFVKFIEDSKTFLVHTNNPFDEGEYTVGLRIGFGDIKDFQTTCSTRIKIKYTPIEDQTTECNQRWVFKIPEYTDFTQGKLGMEIDLQDAAAFLKVQDGFIIYKPVLVVPGDYPIKYTVFSNGHSRDFRFTLGMSCSDFLIPLELDDYVPPVRPNVFVKNPPRPYIASINNVGLIKIAFTQKLLIPSYDLYPEFRRQEYMREVNFTVFWNETLPQAPRQLASVQQKKIEAEAVEIINRGQVFVNKTQLPLVQLSLKPTEGNSFQYKKSFTYKCVSFKESYMEFMANFTHFDHISIVQKDIMTAKFNGPQYFRTPDDAIFAESEIVEVKKQVPQQIEPSLAKQLKKAAILIQHSSKAAVIVNFAMNMVLSGALQKLLAAMKKMQIMIHLLLINVQIPPSAQIFFSSLLKLVTFELIDISSYLRKGLNLEEDAGLSSNFEELGYQSQYSIILLGNLYIALILMLFGLLFIISTKRFKSKQWFNKLRNKLKAQLIWHGALGLINESYLVICISCFVNIMSTKKASKFGEYFSLTNAFLLLVVVLGYPILILIILVKNQPQLHLRKFRTRFGDFYLHFRYKEGRKTVLEPFYSAVRRLIQAATVVFFVTWPWMQLMVIFYTWNIINMRNSRFMIYKLKSDLYADLVNEFFIVLLLYNLLVFSDIVSDQRAKHYQGYVIIAVILLNMVFNFTLIISFNLSQLISALKTKYFIWKRNRLFQRLAHLLDSEQNIDDMPQQYDNISNCQLKKRDLNWYKTVTSTQHQDQKSDGNIQIQVNDEVIEYNRSSEELITIKQKKPITDIRNHMSRPLEMKKQLQIIIEDASNEMSPMFIDPYSQDLFHRDSQYSFVQNAVIKKNGSLLPTSEIPQIEEENLLQDAHYWKLMRENFDKKPTFDMFALQEVQERHANLRTVLQSSHFDEDLQQKNFQIKSRNQKNEFSSELVIEDSKQQEHKQIGNLDDQFALGEKEKKRQLSHRNLFASPEQSHQMFQKLWNQYRISQDRQRNVLNDESQTK